MFKKTINGAIALKVKRFYSKKIYSRRFWTIKKHKIGELFTEYYKSNYWGGKESISGRGSDFVQTEKLIIEIGKLLKQNNIKTILDIPCGDFNWIKNIDFSERFYVGGDIVVDLINKNQDLYNNQANINFEVLDITQDDLPQVDLIICRDCLVHFSYKDINKALLNIKKSNSKLLLVTSFFDRKRNYNIKTGAWRPINLDIKPFKFPQPIQVIIENCTEDNEKYKDKSMCLYEICKMA